MNYFFLNDAPSPLKHPFRLKFWPSLKIYKFVVVVEPLFEFEF